MPAPTATPVLEDAPLSFEEYAARCAEYQLPEQPDDVTYGEFSADLATTVAAMSDTVPPVEVAGWHAKTLSLLQTTNELADAQPEGDPLDPVILLSLVPLAEEIQQIEEGLEEEIRQGLMAAGCIAGDSP